MRRLVSLAEIDPRTESPAAKLGVISMSAIDAVSATVGPPDPDASDKIASARRIALPGDVLLARISPSLENGKVAIVPSLPAGAARVSNELFVLRPRDGIDPRMIWALLRQDALRHELAALATGTAGRRRIDRAVLERIELPTLSEATWGRADLALRRLDEAAAARRIALDRLRRLPGLAAAAAGEGAPALSLAETGAEIRFGYGGKLHPSGAIPVVRRRDLLDGSIAERQGRFLPPDSRRTAPMLRKGDLLMVAGGPRESVGSVAIYEGDPRPGTSFAAGLVRIRPAGNDPDVLWALLQAASVRAFLERSIEAGDRQGIDGDALAHLPVPRPRSESERPLGELARRLRSLLVVANRQRELLGGAVQAHLDQTFSGPVFSDSSAASPVAVVDEALLSVFEVASPDQQALWRAVAAQGRAFRIADLPAAEQDRAAAQHTLSVLSQLGVVIGEREGSIDSWRTAGEAEEAVS